MRIGQFIHQIDLTAGGTSTAFLNTLAALRTRPALQVSAYTLPPVEGDPAWEDVRAHPNEINCVAGWGTAFRPGGLGKAVIAAAAAKRFDLLHIHGVWSPDLLRVGLACRRFGMPYVWEPHGMFVREAYAQKRLKKDVFMLLGMRKALQGAAGMVFVTTEERDSSPISQTLAPERRHVVPLPVRLPTVAVDAAFRRRARERFGVPPEAPCVVFMGRLHPVKRIELALRAAATHLRSQPGLRLLLVGGGDEPYVATLRSLATELGLAQQVLFPGWAQGDDKWLALAAGDALTLNSVHENFGFVAPEALCVGTMPVLTSNLALAAELKEGGVAEIAESSPESLAAAWQRAIAANRAGPVLERGRAWVQRHLSTEAVGERLETVYHAVLGGRRSG